MTTKQPQQPPDNLPTKPTNVPPPPPPKVYLEWNQYEPPKVKNRCPEILEYDASEGSDGIIDSLLLRIEELTEIIDSQEIEINHLKILLEEKEKC